MFYKKASQTVALNHISDLSLEQVRTRAATATVSAAVVGVAPAALAVAEVAFVIAAERGSALGTTVHALAPAVSAATLASASARPTALPSEVSKTAPPATSLLD